MNNLNHNTWGGKNNTWGNRKQKQSPQYKENKLFKAFATIRIILYI